MTGPLQTVHVRVIDAATGQPTPVRVRFTDAEGTHYAPFGRLTEFAAGPNQDVGGNVFIGIKPHAYIDGSCEINLPPGLLQVQIDKGPEYRPFRTEVQLAPGKLALRFQIERWTDLRAQGWYSGDTCVHFLPPHAALLEAQAEDVAVVNLLVKETEIPAAFNKTFTSIPHLPAFSGQDFALQVPGYGVAVNTLNRHPELGSLGLLCSHRVVYPLAFGGPAGKEDWTLADWCDQCHRKGGFVVWPGSKHSTRQVNCGEPLADLLLGKVDAFELDFWEDSPFDFLADYYTLLDAGCRVPLVGASGKESNGTALGVMRTYAHLPPGEAFGYRPWIEAVRAGRTFITNGPLVFLTVEGEEPSGQPRTVEAGARVWVRAEAVSHSAFDRLEVIWNGEVIETIAPEYETTCRATVEMQHTVTGPGWLAARVRGQTHILDRPANQRIFAHTSPCYVDCPGQPPAINPDAVQRLVKELDDMLRWVEEKARCDTPAQRDRLAGVFRAARTALLGRLPG